MLLPSVMTQPPSSLSGLRQEMRHPLRTVHYNMVTSSSPFSIHDCLSLCNNQVLLGNKHLNPPVWAPTHTSPHRPDQAYIDGWMREQRFPEARKLPRALLERNRQHTMPVSKGKPWRRGTARVGGRNPRHAQTRVLGWA